ncbi:hypothetical protein PHAVU_006G035300 [Phaseolus vulgaris]
MVMLLHHGTCFNLRSTTKPLVCKAQCFVLVILCGYGLWWRFMVEVEVVVHGSCFVLRLIPFSHRFVIHGSYSRSWFVRCGNVLSLIWMPKLQILKHSG